MVQLVNKRSGLVFLVADERVNFYLGAGHKLASEVSAEKPSEPAEEQKAEKKPAKKKTTTKKK